MLETVEVLPAKASKITTLISESGVEQSTAIALRSSFEPIMEILAVPLSKAASIVVTDVSQKDLMKQAKDLAKEIATARIACEKTRKALKEDSLKFGSTVQSVANYIKAQCEAAEEHLEAQAKFAERLEAERKAKAKIEREAALLPYGVDIQFVNVAEMSDAQFTSFLSSSKLAHEGKIAAAKKAEEDRIAAYTARIEEETRIRVENAKLKAAAEAAEKAVAAERAKAQAIAKAEQDRLQEIANKERTERLRLEADARQKAEAEAKAVRDAEKAAKAAAKAPDKDKIMLFANTLDELCVPDCSTHEGAAVVARIEAELGRLSAAIRTMANTL